MNWKKWLGIVGVLALIAFIGYSVFGNNEEKDQAYVVRTAELEESDVKEFVSTQGTIDPKNTQEVVGTGIVIDVPVKEGDEVSEGDVLAEYAEMGEIKANFNGTVTEVNIEKESPDINAQVGQNSIVVESLNNLEVGLDLSQNEAHKVKVDQPVILTYQSTEYPGTVTYVAPKASDNSSSNPMAGAGGDSRSLEATISFNDDVDTNELIAGFEIDADIEINLSEGALVLPIEALNFDDDGNPFVFVAQDGKAKQVDIQTGIQSELVIEITEGDLAVGDTVILSPDEAMVDGDEITVEDDSQSDEA